MEETRRIYILEEAVRRLRRDLQNLADRAARAEQMISQASGGPGGGGSGGGAQPVYWAKTPGAVSAATGAWPALTPATFASDVYLDDGGTLTLVATGATIRWFYPDAELVDKLVPCQPNGDSTFDAIASSCSTV